MATHSSALGLPSQMLRVVADVYSENPLQAVQRIAEHQIRPAQHSECASEAVPIRIAEKHAGPHS